MHYLYSDVDPSLQPRSLCLHVAVREGGTAFLSSFTGSCTHQVYVCVFMCFMVLRIANCEARV